MPTCVSRAALVRISTAAAVALTPFRGTAQTAAPLVTLRLGATPSDDMTPIVYGMQAGIFANHGLELDITRMANGPAVMEGVVSGAFDVGKTSVTSIFNAHEKGLPFTIVAIATVYTPQARYAAYIVPNDSPIRTGKDLDGQLVSTGVLGGIGQMALLAWTEEGGGDPKSVRFVEVPYTAAVAAVEQNRVSAAECSYPACGVAIQHGLRLVPVFDALGRQYILTAWVTTRDFSAKHPAVVRAFNRAYVESATYTNAHPAQTAPMMADFTGIPLATIQTMVRGLAGTAIVPAQLQSVIDASVKYGFLAHGFPAAELIDANVR